MEWIWWWREIHNGKWEELKEAASSLASLFSLSACCCPSLPSEMARVDPTGESLVDGNTRRGTSSAGIVFA